MLQLSTKPVGFWSTSLQKRAKILDNNEVLSIGSSQEMKLDGLIFDAVKLPFFPLHQVRGREEISTETECLDGHEPQTGSGGHEVKTATDGTP